MVTPLPGLLVLTDRRQADRSLIDVVAAAVRGGARAVVLREKDLPDSERAALGAQVRELLAPVGGVLIAASRPLPGVDAVHLAAADPLPVPRTRLVGRSCHDAAEVDAATTMELDYVTVSPVWPTTSKPGYGPSLGLPGLAELCARTPLPVYALGGVTADTAAACIGAGAAGAAVMGAVMRAADPAAVVAELLDSMGPTTAAQDSDGGPRRDPGRDPQRDRRRGPRTHDQPVAGGAP